MVQEVYEKLKKQYGLPAYAVVNNELEIGTLETDEFLLRAIRRKIVEKADEVGQILSSILQPIAESLMEMHECRFFDEEDKGKVIELYKLLMLLKRQGSELDLLLEDEKDASFINDFFKEWPDLKKQILPFLGKMKECWQKETVIDENLEYFG